MQEHPEMLMKSLNHIWQAHLPRLARLHAITMIMNIMTTMTVDTEDATINLTWDKKELTFTG
jgi:hypothetical protein